MKKIILIRHSEVDINSSLKISSYDFKNWIDKYNNSNIKTNLPKKDSLISIVDKSDIIICSRLKRSIDSVKIFNKNIFEINEIFNEFELPYFESHLPKFTPKVWLVFFRLLWFIGFSKNSESFKESQLRVNKSVDRLTELSKDYDTITLVGSGLINKFIGKELIKRNWINTKKLENNNLDFGVFEFH